MEFLKRAMKRYGRPRRPVTDRLPSHGAAMKELGNAGGQECGRWLKNRAETSHQPFPRQEGAMARFRDVKTLQKFAGVHASIHNHFNHDSRLDHRDIFRKKRSAALAEWRQLAARECRRLVLRRPVRINLTAAIDQLRAAGPFETRLHRLMWINVARTDSAATSNHTGRPHGRAEH